eukprot:CAMPEP_0198339650 /NCGR_PEP_ID=MMETSP1450-20131203/41427_1 /TAXON_ID=753684 ORGANISM="Madagascaria erythrocladiodes, Strain CCMP3234" /NCGR_SAMPLE_ID=MMETSP1450 /ASSEMBLY_ACC=CAM_ASM_001115 /LENGTH=93 /DNA_ID=CAMNT_0044044593 /DNA_START=78 /DNA_END=355 /DNA_ORIENTATION=+
MAQRDAADATWVGYLSHPRRVIAADFILAGLPLVLAPWHTGWYSFKANAAAVNVNGESALAAVLDTRVTTLSLQCFGAMAMLLGVTAANAKFT